MIAYDAVSSSNIRALAYHAGVGYVEFYSGVRFGYEMPREIFDELRSPVPPITVGKFFAQRVKGTFKVAWSGRRCDLSPCQADATKTGIVAGTRFHLCDLCAASPRYDAVEFTPLVHMPAK